VGYGVFSAGCVGLTLQWAYREVIGQLQGTRLYYPYF
jgi:hypothetical protein